MFDSSTAEHLSNLIVSPLAVIAILLVSCAAHFTLFKFLWNFLAATDINSKPEICRERYYIARKSQRILCLVGCIGVVGTAFIIFYWLVPETSIEIINTIRIFAQLVSPLLIAVNLISLVYMHFFISLAFFRFERQRLSPYLSFGNITVQLEGNNELVGELINLKTIDKKYSLEIRLADGTIKKIDSEKIISFRLYRKSPESQKPAPQDASEVKKRSSLRDSIDITDGG